MLIYEKKCLNTEAASVTINALEGWGDNTAVWKQRAESWVYLTGKKGL